MNFSCQELKFCPKTSLCCIQPHSGDLWPSFGVFFSFSSCDAHKISLCNVLWIKPLKINKKFIDLLKNSKHGGLVIDDDYEDGVAKSIANDLSLRSNKKIHTLGLKNKSAGFSKKGDNLPPSYKEIITKIKKILS